MKEIILKSEYPCLICNGGEQIFLEDNELLSIDAEKNIYVYPVSNKNLFPFSINLFSHSKRYRVFEHKDKTFCCLLSPNTIVKKTIEKIKIAGKDLVITLGENEIFYSLNNAECRFPLNATPNEYKSQAIENFSALILNFENFQELILFNVENNSFKICNGNNFEIKDKQITFSRNYADYSSNIEEISLEFSKNEINETKKHITTQFDIPNEKTICYVFLDAIKEKNFYYAEQLISHNEEKIEEDKIKDFLGNYISFFPLDEKNFAIFYENETKILQFFVEDGKILDFNFI